MNILDQLKTVTVVVADTGDFERIRNFSPKDATTNPTLILKAAKLPAYQNLIQQTIQNHPTREVNDLMDRVLVTFGLEILKIVPGRVSTEIDAALSFDIDASVVRARKIMALYEQAGIGRNRVLIKIAATWEGIQSARILEREGIHTNLTLVFNLIQAVACADAKVQLISPFIGRITDWHKNTLGPDWSDNTMTGTQDPGVISVSNIYNYFKFFDIPTEIMGASFRNIDQIKALAGCDLLTISPELLEALKHDETELLLQLSPLKAKQTPIKAIPCDQANFVQQMADDAMATEKLAEGIRNFNQDIDQLKELLIHY